MTPIADLTDRLNCLAKRREDEGIYADAMIASSAAICLAALEARLAETQEKLIEITATAAEREPVCWIPTATARWLEEYDGPACATQTAVHNRPIKSDGGVPLYAAPLPLTDLEAENARLRERLAEALKALKPLPVPAEWTLDDDMVSVRVGDLRAARRVLEGGNDD